MTTTSTTTTKPASVLVSFELRSGAAPEVFSTEERLSEFKHAMRTGIAAGAGSFFDRVGRDDVRVEEHAGQDGKSVLVIGTLTPRNVDSVDGIFTRLQRRESREKLRHVALLQARRLEGLSGASVAEVKLLDPARGDNSRTFGSVVMAAVRDMEFAPATADHGGPDVTVLDAVPAQASAAERRSEDPEVPAEQKERETEDDGPEVEEAEEDEEGEEGEEAEEAEEAEAEVEEVVDASLIVQGLDFALLTEDEGLELDFKNAVGKVLASAAGGGVGPDDVSVRLTPGSVRVHCTIPCGSSGRPLTAKLVSGAQRISELMQHVVGAITGIDSVTTGDLSVTGLSFSVPPHEAAEGSQGEEEAGDEWSDVDIGVSELLLGVVAGVMFVFYLVNWRDARIRRHAWAIISTTVCIFTAVLLFNGFNDLMAYLLQDAPLFARILASHVLVLALFLLLQVSSGWLSGALLQVAPVNLDEEHWVIDDPTHWGFGARLRAEQLRGEAGDGSLDGRHKGVGYVDGLEVFASLEANERDSRMVDMSCYVSLLTFMTGFAAISAGGSLQQAAPPWTAPWGALLAVAAALAFFSSSFLLCCCGCMAVGRRRRTIAATEAQASEEGGPHELWALESGVAVGDILSLSTSFLLVQFLRFAISGVLPDVEGFEHPERPHSLRCVILLYAAGLVATVLAFSVQHGVRKMGINSPRLLRASCSLVQTCSMTCAWCAIFGTRWAAMRVEAFREWGINPGTMAWQVVLATGATVMTFGLVFALKRVEDAAPGDAEIFAILRRAINTLSLVVGFTWQRSFELGVKRISSSFSHPQLMEVTVSLAIAAVVVPAWRKFILTKVYRRRKMASSMAAEGGAERGDAAGRPESKQQSLHDAAIPLVSEA